MADSNRAGWRAAWGDASLDRLQVEVCGRYVATARADPDLVHRRNLQSPAHPLPDDLADHWVTQPNDNPLFRGQTPVDFMVRAGIPGLQQVRSLVDAERGGH